MSKFRDLEESGDFRKYFLRDYAISIPIGVYDFEKNRSQSVTINIEVLIPLSKTSSSRDDIADVYNYESLVNAVTAVIAGGHVDLQETLIDGVMEEVMKDPRVAAAHVCSEKNDAYADARGIGVEIWRYRNGT